MMSHADHQPGRNPQTPSAPLAAPPDSLGQRQILVPVALEAVCDLGPDR
jgi:hypothetical protein